MKTTIEIVLALVGLALSIIVTFRDEKDRERYTCWLTQLDFPMKICIF